MPFNMQNQRQCKGISKRTKNRCEAPAMRYSEYCRFHGGKLKGLRTGKQHPGYRHGFWCDRLKMAVLTDEKLREHFDKHRDDLGSNETLEDEIALAKTKVEECATSDNLDVRKGWRLWFTYLVKLKSLNAKLKREVASTALIYKQIEQIETPDTERLKDIFEKISDKQE